MPPAPLGVPSSMFGDGTYSGNVVQGGSVLQPVGGVLTVTGAATVTPDSETGASVVMCDTLILDGAGASLKPSTNSKGLIVFARTRVQLLNGARLHIDSLGKAGNFGDLNAYSLAPTSMRRKLKQSALAVYTVSGEGAAGANSTRQRHVANSAPAAAFAMKTGGGGAGGGGETAGSAEFYGPGGHGGKGGPCCGGASGGAGGYSGSGTAGMDAGAYGGPGGNAGTTGVSWGAGGGQGDPVGASSGLVGYAPPTPTGCGGGLCMLFSPSVSIAAGCIVSADGSTNQNTINDSIAAGSTGGGCVCVVTSAGGYINSGTVRANGGAGTTSGIGGTYSGTNGGPGGAGSVNIFTVN